MIFDDKSYFNMKIKPLLLSALFFTAFSLHTVAGSLSNAVPLTANLIFDLEKKWNGFGPANQFNSDEMICWALVAHGNGTNIVYFRNTPSLGEEFAFKLFNENGREMPKTNKGFTYSKPPRQPKDEEDLIRYFKNDGIRRGVLHDLFCPNEMFVIKDKGVYQLEVQMRICVPMTNGMPDTNAMLDFRKAYAATNCGVIESPSVRVKIVKE